LESGAHRKVILSGLALLSNPAALANVWGELQHFRRIRVREAPAFPPEPSSLNSGIAKVAMGCLPAGRPGRSYKESVRPWPGHGKWPEDS